MALAFMESFWGKKKRVRVFFTYFSFLTSLVSGVQFLSCMEEFARLYKA